MELKIVTEAAKLQALKSDWDQLWGSLENPTPQLTYEWFLAGWECFHRCDSLQVIALFAEDGRCQAIAPLVITLSDFHGFKVKKISFPENEQSPSNDFLLNPDRSAKCLAMIVDYLLQFQAWELVDLQKLDQGSVTFSTLKRKLYAADCLGGIRSNIESPYVLISGEWQTFWDARSIRLRKSMRNKLNRAKKSGDLYIEKISITTESDEALEEMLGVSSRSWKKDIGTDLLSKKDNWQFYKTICALFGPKGYIDLWVLRKGEVVIATEFHVKCHGVIYPLRACFDEDYRYLSPGSVLEYNILKTIFNEKKTSEYNTCGHTYKYLLNWTDRSRRHSNAEIYKRSAKMSCLYIAKYKFWPRLLHLRKWFIENVL